MSAPEEYFPLRVNLGQFFNDERQRVLVSAVGVRPVRWLLRKLRRVVPLPARSRLAVLADGCLLPHEEPLELLRNAGVVEIVPVSVRLDQVSSATPAPAENDEIDAPSILMLEPEPIKAKPSPPQPANNVFQFLLSPQETTVSDDTNTIEDPLERQKQQAIQLLEQISTDTPAIMEHEPSETSTEILFAVKSRKRRRVRRRKRVAPIDVREDIKKPEETVSLKSLGDSVGTSDILEHTLSNSTLVSKSLESNNSRAKISDQSLELSWGMLESVDAPQIVRCASVRAPRLVRAESPVRNKLEANKCVVDLFRSSVPSMCVE